MAATIIEVALADARDHAGNESPLVDTLDLILRGIEDIKGMVVKKEESRNV